jgi:hypothetical protein
MVIEKFSDYKQLLKLDYNKLVNETLQDENIQKDMIEFNQKEQLQEGIDAQGKVIETIASKEQNSGYPYSRDTVAKRGSKGLQVNKVDLKDTGAFYGTFEVEVRNDESEIKANYNVHGDDIRDNFSNDYDFLGLIKNSLQNFVEWSFLGLFGRILRRKLGV